MRRREARRLVVAFFDHPAAADAAARSVQRRAPLLRSVGTVGAETGEAGGQPRARLRPRRRADGGGIGEVLDRILSALLEREPLEPEVLFGVGSDVSRDDLARFSVELETGQALVAVLARRRRAERAVRVLTVCGGRAEMHWITSGASATSGGQPRS